MINDLGSRIWHSLISWACDSYLMMIAPDERLNPEMALQFQRLTGGHLRERGWRAGEEGVRLSVLRPLAIWGLGF